MASEAQIKQKILDEEKAKPLPDSDIIYALEATRNYWNTVDTTKINLGHDKLEKLGLL